MIITFQHDDPVGISVGIGVREARWLMIDDDGKVHPTHKLGY
jgi:hypothetical protein